MAVNQIVKIEEVLNLLKSNQEFDNDTAFHILKQISILIANHEDETLEFQVQEIILRALDNKLLFKPYQGILNSLALKIGLYPYLDSVHLSLKEALLLEIHRAENIYTVNENVSKGTTVKSNYIFHKIQAQVFNHLMNDENVILSAPTSFGKSAIIDTLIESGKYKNLVIVVPTIALIDETRQRLFKYKDNYKIITHISQQIQEKNIFIFTQERVLSYQDFPKIDIFIIDEFYKLSALGEDERATMLNLAFYRLLKCSKQFYMLGPNIDGIPEGFEKQFKCRFIRTNFATVVTEVHRIKPPNNKHSNELVKLCHSLQNSTLIFCKSPESVTKIAYLLLDNHLSFPHEKSLSASKWVYRNYHYDWIIGKALEKGIGIHHGQMPRALSQLMVKYFNEGIIKFLICTTTLIEGVNTKAKNIIIFDNKIAKNSLDYFSYNNIKGRSGRMFQHFIGNVYLFHDAPKKEISVIDIPIFNQENSSDSLLIQIDNLDLKRDSKIRLSKFKNQKVLDFSTLKMNYGIEPDKQIKFANHLIANNVDLQMLAWSGQPTYKELERLCELIWIYLIDSKRLGGINSGKQLAFKINLLSQRKSIKDLIEFNLESNYESNNNVNTVTQKIFQFERQWIQFRFSKLALAANNIQNDVARRYPVKAANYENFIKLVENQYYDPVLTSLDEYGIPFPLAIKLEKYLSTDGDIDKALLILKNLNINKLNLTKFEEELIEEVRLYT